MSLPTTDLHHFQDTFHIHAPIFSSPGACWADTVEMFALLTPISQMEKQRPRHASPDDEIPRFLRGPGDRAGSLGSGRSEKPSRGSQASRYAVPRFSRLSRGSWHLGCAPRLALRRPPSLRLPPLLPSDSGFFSRCSENWLTSELSCSFKIL